MMLTVAWTDDLCTNCGFPVNDGDHKAVTRAEADAEGMARARTPWAVWCPQLERRRS